MTMRKSSQQIMIDWMKNFLVEYPIPPLTPFPQSMQDGKVFCYLVHKTDPNLIDISNVNSRSALENIKIAFTAGAKIGIPALLDAEDVIQAPDNHSILTYLSFYRQKAKGDGAIGKSPAPVAAAPAANSDGAVPTAAPKGKANFAYGGAIKAAPKSFAGGGIKAIAKAPASLEVPKAQEVAKSPMHSPASVTETSEVHISVATTATETKKVVETIHHESSVKTELSSDGNKSITEVKTHVAEIKAESVAQPKVSTPAISAVHTPSATPKASAVPSSPKTSQVSHTSHASATSATSVTPSKGFTNASSSSKTSTLPTSFSGPSASASSVTSPSSSNNSAVTTQSKIKGLTGKFESPTSSPTTTKLRITTNNSSSLSSKTSVSSSPISPTKSGTTTTTSYKSTTSTTSKTTTTASASKK
eukprot:TRINITY_DN926_c0_g1_i2.p1 TRINITY_DN926_c0_g1~~TRINITY_DN926_c0_g1_i2.p1  ORF type:complete len:417 (-),score=88.80 TRINITY_DN926_c0_g1_i2:187-1437(-)